MKLIVASRDEVEAGLAIREPFVLISISDPDKPKPRPRRTALCRGVLSLRFHDAEPTTPFRLPADIRLMSRQQAKRVWDFIRLDLRDVAVIAVHCEAGMSRSPAIAAAIGKVINGDGTAFFREYQPNRYVYDLMISSAPAPG
jgi:predicted protein tyrosine phosphatase